MPESKETNMQYVKKCDRKKQIRIKEKERTDDGKLATLLQVTREVLINTVTFITEA